MISLVYVIFKAAKQNEDEAWRRIEEAFLEFRALAAVEAARYSYHHIPYPGIYSSAASLYPSVYLPSMPLYPHPHTALFAAAPTSVSPPSSQPSPPSAILSHRPRS